MSDILTRNKADSLTIYLSMSVPNFHPLEYYLKLVSTRWASYEISLETLSQQSNAKDGEPVKYSAKFGCQILQS
jgi:hypothetical protein